MENTSTETTGDIKIDFYSKSDPEFQYVKIGDLSNPSGGFYVMGNYIKFKLNKKPSWIHRKFMKLFMDWSWEDI